MKTIIVDDESSGREILSTLLNEFCPNIEIVAVCDNIKDAIQQIQNLQPNLVFLDIEMTSGSGFDVLDAIKDKYFEVIFVTAHHQYALQAIKASALDYLLKPVNIEELILAVSKASERLKNNNGPGKEVFDILIKKLAGNQKIDRLSLPTQKGYEIIKISEIVYARSEDNYTRFFMKDGKAFLVSKTIKTYEEILEQNQFMRIHKSHIVNLNEIKKYNHGAGGEVELSNGSILEVSRNKKQDLLDYLKG
jgi:two-component system LytT family response regulator